MGGGEGEVQVVPAAVVGTRMPRGGSVVVEAALGSRFQCEWAPSAPSWLRFMSR